MIIDASFFKGLIYISHAKPSISDNVTNVGQNVKDFIEVYARECLISVLGYHLFSLLEAELDPSEANGLKSGSDVKWDRLLNGYDYTDSDGYNVHWKGIRYKSNLSGKYDMSFLADYVYVQYESSTHIVNSGVGHNKQKPKGGYLVSPNHKVTIAWRRFFKEVQGADPLPKSFTTKYGWGVDYFNQFPEASLYQFIDYMNEQTEDYYPGFKPKEFTNMNQMGI